MAEQARANSISSRGRQPLCTALAASVALALALTASAYAAGDSIGLSGPHSNLYGTAFQYKAAGRAGGAANYVYAWEAPYSPKCASQYKVESKRAGTFLFVNKSVGKNKHFALTVDFFARNLERHRLCAYLINKSSHTTFAHAEATWKNYAATPSPSMPSTGSLQPTAVGEGQCKAKRFPDESVDAQIAYSNTTCVLAEQVMYGADGAKGASYSKDSFSCTGTAEGAGSTWATAWTGTYYEYSCADGAEQVAFNWGGQYAYAPAASLPTIAPSS